MPVLRLMAMASPSMIFAATCCSFAEMKLLVESMLIPSSRACALLFSMADDVLEQRSPCVLRTVHFKGDVLTVDAAIDEHLGQNDFANAGALDPGKPIGVFANPQRPIKGAYLVKYSAAREERLTHITGSRPCKWVTLEARPLVRQRFDPEVLYVSDANARIRICFQRVHLALEFFRTPGIVGIEKREEVTACDP